MPETPSPTIILASKSPRRQELLEQMDIHFKVVLKDVDESYPEDLKPADVALYIAQKKAEAFDDVLHESEIVITADTIVTIDGLILGKPKDEQDAFDMLTLLSGRKHEVITAVALLHKHQIHVFHDITYVYFRELSADEILFYIRNYKPFDKAGSYGIQEWIGHNAIEKIDGSYTNVVGLPTFRLAMEIKKLLSV
ncbi:Septum formation protein Maf [Arcticibacter svalbardensis MN12-7]|uniref:dTTP/UTP pyrophosphatase n=1 Tax=Arcticibacter svalbardensis MN12-7 TaxID=1150600 RepID=R9GQ09_9SPHI|nr:Maf family nucleotide pyrophosphatase [Arcticibacter svalbardensis]EOR93793.1 Septum formation protein Maf [Arcticibacter svalbardensis MN12-7]